LARVALRGATAIKTRVAASDSGELSDSNSSASTSTAAGNAPLLDPRFTGLKVFVAGAAGGTGSCVVKALRAKGVPVRALVRDSVRAASRLPPAGEGLEIVEGDGG